MYITLVGTTRILKSRSCIQTLSVANDQLIIISLISNVVIVVYTEKCTMNVTIDVLYLLEEINIHGFNKLISLIDVYGLTQSYIQVARLAGHTDKEIIYVRAKSEYSSHSRRAGFITNYKNWPRQYNVMYIQFVAY